MGYDIEVTCENVLIPGAKVAGALEALKLLMEGVDHLGRGGSWSGGKQLSANFSWVDTAEVMKHLARKDLVSALEAWSWRCEAPPEKDELEILGDAYVDHQDIKVSYYAASKSGQEDVLWETLSPFVKEGAVIEFRGEDDARWRYVFTGCGMKEQTGETVWKE